MEVNVDIRGLDHKITNFFDARSSIQQWLVNRTTLFIKTMLFVQPEEQIEKSGLSNSTDSSHHEIDSDSLQLSNFNSFRRRYSVGHLNFLNVGNYR